MSQSSDSLAGRPLVQVALTVRDLARARAFYRDVLGLPLLFEASGMMFFQLAGLRLLVGAARDAATPIGGSVLYFDAPDFDAVARALEAKGVVFQAEPLVVQRAENRELRLREFLDPDGNALALMGWVAT
jgi:extradiol dioxygenase family protein